MQCIVCLQECTFMLTFQHTSHLTVFLAQGWLFWGVCVCTHTHVCDGSSELTNPRGSSETSAVRWRGLLNHLAWLLKGTGWPSFHCIAKINRLSRSGTPTLQRSSRSPQPPTHPTYLRLCTAHLRPDEARTEQTVEGLQCRCSVTAVR